MPIAQISSPFINEAPVDLISYFFSDILETVRGTRNNSEDCQLLQPQSAHVDSSLKQVPL